MFPSVLCTIFRCCLLFPTASIDPVGRSEQRESKDPADAVHARRPLRSDRDAPVRTPFEHDHALLGDERGPVGQMSSSPNRAAIGRDPTQKIVSLAELTWNKERRTKAGADSEECGEDLDNPRPELETTKQGRNGLSADFPRSSHSRRTFQKTKIGNAGKQLVQLT